MNLVVTSQHRYCRTPDGAIWTDGKYGYSFWQRYLDVFSQVRVVARVRDLPDLPADWKPVSGEGVTIWPLRFVRGAWQWFANSGELRRSAIAAVAPRDAVILRAPGEVACCLDAWLWQNARPYGVECVGDPFELYAPGAVRSFARPFLRRWYPPRLRRECARSAAAAYVTSRTLQQRYPPPAGGFTTHYSSIELGDEAFVSESRRFASRPADEPFRLVFVGTLAQLYKAPDVVIDAVAQCVRRGLNVQLRMLGDGQHRAELEQRAARLGLAGCVTFVGQVPTAAGVRAELDAADLFVSPSRQEGLPRAMIEAMARALPCIGSTAGGTAELLSAASLVPPGDAGALARTVAVVLADAALMTKMSKSNLSAARDYHQEILRERRRAMYGHLRDATEGWLRGADQRAAEKPRAGR